MIGLKSALTGLSLIGGLLLVAGTAWAADAEPSAFDYWWKFGWRIGNFLILAGLIYKVAKEPAKSFFKGKREEAEEILAELEEAKVKAQAELDGLKAKLANADQEIADVVAQLKAMAVRNRENVLAEAKRLAEETIIHARAAADTEIERARQHLVSEAGLAVIELAAEKLKAKLTPEDHIRIVDDTLNSLAAQYH